MAFDESLAARIRAALARRKGVGERRMFGGLCFLLHGNLLVGDNLCCSPTSSQAFAAIIRVNQATGSQGSSPPAASSIRRSLRCPG